MRWPDEIRDPTQLLPPLADVTEEEIEGAFALMETMTRDDLEGEEFRDTYTEAMAQIIEAKREDRELPEAPEPEQPARVVDLMAALQESVQKARASRGETEAEMHELPAKRTAAKKTTKKAAAKKTSGRPPRSA
jgi:DNA end-binding protein Ku